MATVLVSFPTRLYHPRRTALRDTLTITQPAFSAWRSDSITTRFDYRANGKLYCHRHHPHRGCTGRFTLLPDQLTTLLAAWTGAVPLAVVLPQPGKTRVEAWHLPDDGMQLIRFDKRRKQVETFRIFAADVADFLAFSRRVAPLAG